MRTSSQVHQFFRAIQNHLDVKKTPTDINRLFSAADALLEAVQAPEGKDTIVEVTFDDRAGTAEVHGSRFTSDEMVEAMGFLIRAGYLEPA